jgi:hypothetical protein
MKSILAVLVSLFLLSPAHSATAFLVSCHPEAGVTGRLIYVGTYTYGGRYFERTFTQWCPSTIEVY